MDSVRKGYEELGIDKYYERHNEDYENPHYEIIRQLLEEYLIYNDIGIDILDLCCGSGEITTILESCNKDYKITGIDPYTKAAYKKKTNKDCLSYTFKDIVQGKMLDKKYDTIICSCAMHLCEESMLDMLLYQLGQITNNLIILTPHKRPNINNWFILKDEYIKNKVRLRVYEKRRI